MELTVEKNIKFKVHIVTKWADAFGTGDAQSYNQFEVRRFQMRADIPHQNGGGKQNSICGLSEEVLQKQNKEGVGSYGIFKDEDIAQLFVDQLNAMEQSDLRHIFRATL